MPARILVVDDEADLDILVLHKFRQRISEGELDFRFARDGEQALTVLEEAPDIELVITDINMPVMDGLTLLERLSRLSRLTKAIIVSAYDDLDNIRVAMNRGAYDFLTKPIDFPDLEITIDKTLRELEGIRNGLAAQEQLTVLEHELKLAEKIQRSILPEVIDDHAEFEIAATMIPARQVSGDFYDFFLIGQSRLGFAVGDVSGKGIPAALFMAVSRTLLRATALHGCPPHQCLEHVNRVLVEQSKGEVFLTLVYGILDLTSGDFDFSVAAHVPPFLCSPDREETFLREPTGMMLGLFADAEYETRRVRLSPGEGVVFYTDGVTEAESADGKFFTEKRLEALLKDADGCAAEEVTSKIAAAVESFSEGSEHADDVTILAVRFKPPR